MSLAIINQDRVTRYRDESTSALLKYANDKRLVGQFNDVTIKAEGESIPANRMVLSCYSKFFETMFLTEFKEQYQDHVDIRLDGNAIKATVQYMYTGCIDIDGDNVMSLLAIADFLQMEDIKQFCFEFLESSLTVDNCIDIFQISSMYRNPLRSTQIFQVINNNFELIIAQSESIGKLSKDDFVTVLAKLDSHIVEESWIYTAIINWVNHNESRKQDFAILFLGLDIHKIPIQFLDEVVVKESLVQQNTECLNAVLACTFKKLRVTQSHNEDQDRNTQMPKDSNLIDNKQQTASSDLQKLNLNNNDNEDADSQSVQDIDISKHDFIYEVMELKQLPANQHTKRSNDSLESSCVESVLKDVPPPIPIRGEPLRGFPKSWSGNYENSFQITQTKMLHSEKEKIVPTSIPPPIPIRGEQLRGFPKRFPDNLENSSQITQTKVLPIEENKAVRTSIPPPIPIRGQPLGGFPKSLPNNLENSSQITQTKILRIGGMEKIVKEIYNTLGETKQQFPKLPRNLSDHRALALNGVVYCMGGQDSGIWSMQAYDKVYKMDSKNANLKWEETTPMNKKKYLFGAAIFGGNLVVAGGCSDGCILKDVELYEVLRATWRKLSPIQEFRQNPVLVSSGDSLFVIGGRNGAGKLSTVERLDMIEGDWKFVQSMHTARCDFAAVCCRGFIYAIGGSCNNKLDEKTVEMYNPVNDQWSFVKDMDVRRKQHDACVLQEKIYVVGGSSFKANDAIACFDPTTCQWTNVEPLTGYNVQHALVTL